MSPLRIEEQRFSRGATLWMYRLVGLALLAVVASDLLNGRRQVHEGLLWARRLQLGGLYPARWLCLEWGILSLSAAGLVLGRTRAVRTALPAVGIGLWSLYMNQRALLFLTLAYLAMGPAVPEAEDFERRPHPQLSLVRYQVLIVYFFSAVNKLAAGFCTGASLTALFANMAMMRNQPLIPPQWTSAVFHRFAGVAPLLASAIVAGELLLPLALLKKPRLGVPLVAAFHLALGLLMPDLWVFGLVMTADSLLFLAPEGYR